MARAATPTRLIWQLGRVLELIDKTPRRKSIVLELVLTVERLEDGEVSPYLTEELRPGDELELPGPIGGYFVWEPSLGGPLLMIANGSGVVPFRAMLRRWAERERKVPARLLYCSRTLKDVIYREELERLQYDGAEIHLTLTRRWPEHWQGHRGRVDRALLRFGPTGP